MERREGIKSEVIQFYERLYAETNHKRPRLDDLAWRGSLLKRKSWESWKTNGDKAPGLDKLTMHSIWPLRALSGGTL